MTNRLSERLDSLLPITGGGLGALTSAKECLQFLPSWENVIGTIVITIIGGITGYMVKLLLDKLFKK